MINYQAVTLKQLGLDDILEAPESQTVSINVNRRNIANNTIIQGNRDPVQQCIPAYNHVEIHNDVIDDIEINGFSLQHLQEQLHKYILLSISLLDCYLSDFTSPYFKILISLKFFKSVTFHC